MAMQVEMQTLLEKIFSSISSISSISSNIQETYLENYKSDPNLKSIKVQNNYFVIKYIIW